MSQNPYAAPASNISEPSSGPVRMYSPGQVAGGVFLGGPIAAVYFLRANFIALKDGRSAKAAMVYGPLFIVAAIILAFLLPKNFPSLPINIAYMVMARQMAEKYQLSKEAIAESAEYKLHSNWRVVGLALLCVLGSGGLFVLGYLVLHLFGIFG